MATPLTAGQRAQLEAELTRRQGELARRLADHRGGLTRAERAHELLEQEADNAPERENELGLDGAIIEIEARELAAVRQALARLQGGDYGICAECDGAIPFGRLQVEPWALRCVKCEGAREAAGR
ncbi:Putative dnaK suppressor [Rubrivivax sp. A210]|uniref:TraR/DksA family transcriptional regulator n=1 Tax=Rubrivivax sp. A210 TaxID=2772301 RepID=UPI00191A18EF|nr:TraR/DksA C4-type zinc finger protein [Rubrivivax sp. A210]CAD5373135.1 Putative dnaK suppressor [Rubrivivax sp. A210]